MDCRIGWMRPGLACVLVSALACAQEPATRMTRKEGQRLPFVLTAAVRTGSAPAVDGKLDDACWTKAAAALEFVLYGGKGYAVEQTQARVLWDDSALYIGMRCFDSDIGRLKKAVTERDGPVWMDDCIEIFFIPPESPILASAPQAERYFHLCVNAAGASYDEVGYEAPGAGPASGSPRPLRTRTAGRSSWPSRGPT